MDFKFYIPGIDIVKAVVGEPSKNFKIKGLASTPTKDKEGDVIHQNFDLSEFKWINYEHGKNPHETIGEITKHKVTSKGLEIEGELYYDNELAKEVYSLAVNMAKSGNGNKLGLSVEGRTIERDPKAKNNVVKAQLYAVAICKTPMNGDTFVDIQKSLKQQEKKTNTENMDKSFYDQDAIEKAYSLLGVSSEAIEKAYKKGFESANDEEEEEEEEEEVEEEEVEEEEVEEVEMKKAIGMITDLKGKGRSNSQIVKALKAYGIENIAIKDIDGLLARGGETKSKEEAIDLVKSYFNDNFQAIGTVFKSFESNQEKVIGVLENLQAQIDAFGAKTGLSKSDISKGVKQSPMDGSPRVLDLRNPAQKTMITDLAEKHLNIDVASSIELTGFISKANRDELKKATGYDVIG